MHIPESTLYIRFLIKYAALGGRARNVDSGVLDSVTFWWFPVRFRNIPDSSWQVYPAIGGRSEKRLIPGVISGR